MMSYQDVMIICSDLPAGKPLCMHIGTAMVRLHIFLPKGSHWQVYLPINSLYLVYPFNSSKWIALLPKGGYLATPQTRSVMSFTLSTLSQWHFHN